jgi:lipopolysaccharide/colanic/teichoic acid biosynthesis glycosyltransferase
MALPQDKSIRRQSRTAKVAILRTQLPPMRHAKRFIDVALAAAGLLLFSPLIAIVTVAIRLDSRGPIFSREVLYGYAHQKIQAFKFRTMVTRADGDRTGSGVSRIGSVLHQTGIDELPRLLNVLRGELSIVGPCAFTNRHDFANGNVTSLLAEFNPGLTGWAQLIELRKGFLTTEQRITEDLHYVEKWSVLLDLKIIMMTLFLQKAAAAVSPGP